MRKVGTISETLSGWLVRCFATCFVLAGATAVMAQGDASHPIAIPNEDLWLMSGHADVTAEAFIHWDDTDPPEVPTSCAKCHSSGGFQDFLGADGTEAGQVDNPAPIGTTIDCLACHNSGTAELDSVVMPSGAEITGLGNEAVCMQCHQGRESSASVDAYLADKDVNDVDAVNPSLGFRNMHYMAAAATQLGTFAKGGYQYEGEARYNSWTPRLLRAAYNYQYALKDPGAFAHNGKYIIQVLYDALDDLSAKVSVETTRLIRP